MSHPRNDARERDFAELSEGALRAGLAAAGFKVAELRSTTALIPVSTAWMATTCLPGEGGRSDVTFDLGDPDLVEHLNDAWIRLAEVHGLFGEDRTFLLSVSLGPSGNPDAPFWATVSLMDSFDIAGVGAEAGIFGSQRGMVEFTVASVDGRVVIRGTLWQHAVGILVLTEADRSEQLRLFTQGMLDRGVLSEIERASAELWMTVAEARY